MSHGAGAITAKSAPARLTPGPSCSHSLCPSLKSLSYSQSTNPSSLLLMFWVLSTQHGMDSCSHLAVEENGPRLAAEAQTSRLRGPVWLQAEALGLV